MYLDDQDDSILEEARAPEDVEEKVFGQEVAMDIDVLAGRLAEAEKKAEENYQSLLRVRAESENFRKRCEEDIAKVRKYSLEEFAKALLPVVDSLRAAASQSSSDPKGLQAGVDVTLKQLSQVLSSNSVKEISPLPGNLFDPHLHQAVSVVSSEQPPNTVVGVLQKGYKMVDRVLRPALVTVSENNRSLADST